MTVIITSSVKSYTQNYNNKNVSQYLEFNSLYTKNEINNKIMRNRNLYFAKIESIEGKLKSLQMMVKMGQPIQDFLNTTEQIEEILQDVKDMMSREAVESTEL